MIKVWKEHGMVNPLKTRCERVGRDEDDNLYIFMWGRDGVGWVRADNRQHAEKLLAEPIERSTR